MPKKVFELAKELELGPLDLVELLKAKGLAVRNHMSELSDAEVNDFLAAHKKDKEIAASQDEVKKKVVRKKAPAIDAKTVEKKTVEAKSSAPAKEKSKPIEAKKVTSDVK